MSLAHLTLATRDVEKTAPFFEQTLGYRAESVPTNIPDEAVWLDHRPRPGDSRVLR